MFKGSAIGSAIGLVLAICLGGVAQAQVKVEDSWIRATAPGQTVAGGYMKITSEKPLTLISVSTPLTHRAELHHMSMQGGVMKMRAVPKIALPAGETVELKPGGYHLMLMNLSGPLHPGDTVPVTLTFEGTDKKQEQVRINVEVRDLTGTAPGDQHMKHGH